MIGVGSILSRRTCRAVCLAGGLWALGGGVCWIASAADGDPPVRVRSSVVPEARIWEGQRVLLRVDVLSPEGWARVRSIRDFEVPGVVVVPADSQGIRLQETIEGVAYSGQQTTISLYPKRSGLITVPPVAIDVEITRWGADADVRIERHQTPPVEFTVSSPPGTEGRSEWVTTPALTATQTWDPRPESLRVGDAVKRTLAFEAQDVSGMAFPPMTQDPIPGVGLYPDQPRVEERSNRGEIVGSRIETWTYVFERAGDVTLPDVELAWFDPDSETLRVEILKGLTMSVVALPAGIGPQADNVPISRRVVPWGVGLFAVLIGGLTWVLTRSRWARAGQWAIQRLCRSEPAAFHRFRRACRDQDARTVYKTLITWLDQSSPNPGVVRLDRFARRYGTEETQDCVAALHAALGDDTSFDRRRLVRTLAQARQRRRSELRRVARAQQTLPPLNPPA